MPTSNPKPTLSAPCWDEGIIEDGEVIDVAIIGGGASGAYSAYRIMHAEPGKSAILDGMRDENGSLDVRLFEGSNRIGGRLWSLNQKNLPTIELGGQGFSQLMQNVYGLCTKELGLKVRPCTAFSVGPQLQYFRQHIYRNDLYDPFPPPLPTEDDPDEIEKWRGEAIEYFRAIQPYFPHLYKIPMPTKTHVGGSLKEAGDWCEKVKEHIRASPTFYPHVVPYFLSEKERWQVPDDLILNVLKDRIVRKRDGMKFDEVFENVSEAIASSKGEVDGNVLTAINNLVAFLREAEVQGPHELQEAGGISEHGFWNLLAEMLSTEAYNMVSLSSYASSYFGNWNLYDTCLCYLLVGFTFMLKYPAFWEVEGGYQQVPEKLVTRFKDKGGKVYCRHKLYSIEREQVQGESLIALKFHTSGHPKQRTCYARKVILAMPKRALELVGHHSFIFKNSRLRTDMNAVTAVPAIKIFLPFEKPWWKNIPNQDIAGGWSTTDLPMRTCYYMGPKDPDNPDEHALLLASFNDEEAYAFWANYYHTVTFGRTGRMLPVQEPDEDEDIFHEMLRIKAPDDMEQALLDQLTELHGCNVPDPLKISGAASEESVETVYQNWTEDPYGGGWHNWNPHVKSWELMPRIRRLSVAEDADAQIFLCGEAYSAAQGWVEGALNTAEKMLEDYFDLPRPDWVNEEYDFGP